MKTSLLLKKERNKDKKTTSKQCTEMTQGTHTMHYFIS